MMRSTILITEDHEAQRLFYETEMQEMGYQVILAKDGLDAIEKIRDQRPDVVIMDLDMDNMHGLEALRRILSIDPTIPVIIHTAYSHYQDRFLSWAAEEYIVKSSDLVELKKAIKRALATRCGDFDKVSHN